MRNSKPRLALLGIGIILLICTFYYLQPAPTRSFEAGHERAEISPKTTIRAAAEATAAKPAPAPPPLIRIIDGQRAAGPAVLRVRQDDFVRLRFLADQDYELHLHGYDHSLQLVAGEEFLLQFRALLSGRFEYELHGHHQATHAALGVIEVHPR